MFDRKYIYLCFLLTSSFFLTETPRAQTPTPESSPQQTETSSKPETTKTAEPQENSENLIHFGDLIDVDVVGSTEFDWRGSINPEGFLSGVGFIEEPIFGLCRSEDEVAAALAKGLGKLLNNPKVNVKIIDRSARPVSTIFGAVKTAQRFQIRRPVRLNELIILSGGITDDASGEIQILRPPNLSCQLENEEKIDSAGTGQNEKIIPAKLKTESRYINIKISDLLEGNADANPLILTGDIITIKEAEPVYITGGIVNPKKLNLNAPLTLSRAIDSAGGFSKDADKKIIIFRRENNEVKTIEVDLNDEESSGKDFALKGLDVVEVPRRGKAKSRFPPVLNVDENKNINDNNSPLRIID